MDTLINSADRDILAWLGPCDFEQDEAEALHGLTYAYSSYLEDNDLFATGFDTIDLLKVVWED